MQNMTAWKLAVSSLHPLDPHSDSAAPHVWVLLSLPPPPSASTGKAYSPAGQPFSWDLLISGTALVADDSAMKTRNVVLGRASLPLMSLVLALGRDMIG